jgi:hypothetical protein
VTRPSLCRESSAARALCVVMSCGVAAGMRAHNALNSASTDHRHNPDESARSSAESGGSAGHVAGLPLVAVLSVAWQVAAALARRRLDACGPFAPHGKRRAWGQRPRCGASPAPARRKLGTWRDREERLRRSALAGNRSQGREKMASQAGYLRCGAITCLACRCSAGLAAVRRRAGM